MPDDFRFSVKMPRTMSHDAGLHGAVPLLDPFLDAVQALGSRLGALLLQLPPSLVYDGRTVSAFLRALRRRTATPVACEPRHDSWFQAPADALLRRYGIARVAADPVRHPAGAVPGGDTGWSYWRWHGSPRIYYSEYDEATLKDLAEAVVERAGSARPAWVILDNTAHGFAVPNALRLQSLFNWP